MNVGNVGVMPQMAQTNPMSNTTSSFMQGMFDTVKLALTMQRDRQRDAQDATYNQARTGLINAQIQEYNDTANRRQAVSDYLSGNTPSVTQPSSGLIGGGLNSETAPAQINIPPMAKGVDAAGGAGNPGFDENTRNSFMQGFYDTTKLAMSMSRDNQNQAQVQPQPEPQAMDSQNLQQVFYKMAQLTGDPTYIEKAASLTPETKYGTATVHTKDGNLQFVTVNGIPDMNQPIGTASPDKHAYQDFGYGRMIDENGNVVNVPVKPDKPDKASYGHIILPTADGSGEQVFITENGLPVQAVGGVKKYGAANGKPSVAETAIYKEMQKNQDAYRQLNAKKAGGLGVDVNAINSLQNGLHQKNLELAKQLRSINPNSPYLVKGTVRKTVSSDPLGLR